MSYRRVDDHLNQISPSTHPETIGLHFVGKKISSVVFLADYTLTVVKIYCCIQALSKGSNFVDFSKVYEGPRVDICPPDTRPIGGISPGQIIITPHIILTTLHIRPLKCWNNRQVSNIISKALS